MQPTLEELQAIAALEDASPPSQEDVLQDNAEVATNEPSLEELQAIAQLEEQPAPQAEPIPTEGRNIARGNVVEQKIEKVGGVPIKEEQHPDITVAERAIIKNLAASPKAAQMFLVKKHPNADIKLNKDGRILFRRPNETEYRVIDPKGVDLQDVSDIAYDVASGIGESAATIAGGMGGATLGPLGALGGASAASSASAAASEALRQKLGQALGLPQEVNTQDVLMSAGMGAVSPLLFGAGGKVAEKSLKKALTTQLTKQALDTKDNILQKVIKKAGNVGKGTAQTVENVAQVLADKGPF